MRKFTWAMLMLAWISYASITPGTLHQSEAQRIENNFTRNGLSSDEFEVNIARLAGTTDYYIAWYGINWGDTGDAFIRSGFSIMSTADAIRNSNWTPTYLFIGFEDYMVRMNTSSVTYLASNLNELSDAEVQSYFSDHVTVLDYPF